jgi:translation initiation factor 2 beta subunit (eIF-2beta)/eIF-5
MLSKTNGDLLLSAERFKTYREFAEGLKERIPKYRRETLEIIREYEEKHSMYLETMEFLLKNESRTLPHIDKGAVLLDRIMNRGKLIQEMNKMDTHFKTCLAFFKACLKVIDEIATILPKIKRNQDALSLLPTIKSIMLSNEVADLLFDCGVYCLLVKSQISVLKMKRDFLAVD